VIGDGEGEGVGDMLTLVNGDGVGFTVGLPPTGNGVGEGVGDWLTLVGAVTGDGVGDGVGYGVGLAPTG